MTFITRIQNLRAQDRRLVNYSTLILVGLVAVSLLVAVAPLSPYLLFSQRFLADVSGFLALFLISATGVMMLFRKGLLARTKDTYRLRWLHVVIASLGGLFLVVHVTLSLFFPETLPVLFGAVASGSAVVIWVTGTAFLEGLRHSLFYHGVLSLVGISLIIVHTFTAGRNIPMAVSGASLTAIGLLLIIGVGMRVFDWWTRTRPSGG